MAAFTFFIKVLSLRVPENLTTNHDCSETHDMICVFLGTLLIVKLPDEILMIYGRTKMLI